MELPLDRQLAEVFHPAEFIKEELAERGWSLNDFVFAMRRYESEKDWQLERLAVEMYLEVQDVRILLSDEMAQGFATAFGVSKEFFVNLDKIWRTNLKTEGVKEREGE